MFVTTQKATPCAQLVSGIHFFQSAPEARKFIADGKAREIDEDAAIIQARASGFMYFHWSGGRNSKTFFPGEDQEFAAKVLAALVDSQPLRDAIVSLAKGDPLKNLYRMQRLDGSHHVGA